MTRVCIFYKPASSSVGCGSRRDFCIGRGVRHVGCTMAVFKLGYNSMSLVASDWGEWLRQIWPQILVSGIMMRMMMRMMMTMMKMRMVKMAVPHQWSPSMEDPRLFPIEQAAAQQLRNIANGTMDPGIEYYDLIGCFNFVNNLCSNFIFINRNCGFCSNRILLYFPMCVCLVCVSQVWHLKFSR